MMRWILGLTFVACASFSMAAQDQEQELDQVSAQVAGGQEGDPELARMQAEQDLVVAQRWIKAGSIASWIVPLALAPFVAGEDQWIDSKGRLGTTLKITGGSALAVAVVSGAVGRIKRRDAQRRLDALSITVGVTADGAVVAGAVTW